MDGRRVFSGWGRILARLSARTSRLKSPGNARCVARAATPTATSTSAGASCCASWPTTRAQRTGRRTLAAGEAHEARAPVDRRRRAARAVPRTRTSCSRSSRRWVFTPRSSPARCGRFRSEWAKIPNAADLRVDRRTAARARRAARAGDLRSDPESHQGPAGDRALHDHASADAAGLRDGIRRVLGRAAGRAEDLVQPVHAAAR